MSDDQHRDVGHPPPGVSEPYAHENRISDHDGISRATLEAIVNALGDADAPAMTQCGLAEAVDASATTVRRATDALERDGVIRAIDWGGTKTYYLRHPASEWPIPPDVELATEVTFDAGADSTLNVLLGDPPLCWRNLALAGGYLTIMQAVMAVAVALVGFAESAELLLSAAIVTLATAATLAVAVLARQRMAPYLQRMRDKYQI